MIILGLGSNVGDREAYLRGAVVKLSAMLGGLETSRVLESAAVLPEGSPADWNKPYLNMVVAAHPSNMTPGELLTGVKNLEAELGRTRSGHWGPREIDIDILAIGEEIIHSPDLIVPHEQVLLRDFMLLPLADAAPLWRWPLPGEYFGKTAAAIAAAKGFSINKNLRETGIAIYG